MLEVERCLAWVPSMSDLPQVVSVMENGTYRLDGHDLEPEQVTQIPTAEWLRANESDFRELLDACKALLESKPYRRVACEPLDIINDIVERRWKPTPS